MADRISGTKDVRLQRRKVGWKDWTAREKAGFLDHLAATGNVRRAAAAVGRTDNGAYRLRRDPAFAAAWAAALDDAYGRLQAGLIEHALGDPAIEDKAGEDKAGDDPSGSDGSGGDATPCPTCGARRGRAFDPELALRVLKHRDAMIVARAAGGSRFRRPEAYRRMSIELVEASLERKIAAILKMRPKTAGKDGGRA